MNGRSEAAESWQESGFAAARREFTKKVLHGPLLGRKTADTLNCTRIIN